MVLLSSRGSSRPAVEPRVFHWRQWRNFVGLVTVKCAGGSASCYHTHTTAMCRHVDCITLLRALLLTKQWLDAGGWPDLLLMLRTALQAAATATSHRLSTVTLLSPASHARSCLSPPVRCQLAASYASSLPAAAPTDDAAADDGDDISAS